MAPNFAGKWKEQRNEKLAEFLTEIGTPYLVRKAMAHLPLTVNITQDGDDFDIRTVTMVKILEQKFTVGEEFEEVNPFGEKAIVIASWEGEKLVIRPTVDPGKPWPVVCREFVDDVMLLTLTVNDVVCKRYFKKS
ncbi:cellular retinoic acid-binding protein 1-like [Glandiceps talaboti]